jgi:hypothetical protein
MFNCRKVKILHISNENNIINNNQNMARLLSFKDDPSNLSVISINEATNAGNSSNKESDKQRDYQNSYIKNSSLTKQTAYYLNNDV